jgi:hypothetical protein
VWRGGFTDLGLTIASEESVGSNVRDVFAKYLGAGKRKKIDLCLEILDGGVPTKRGRTQQTCQIDKIILDFTLPADRSRPWELTTLGSLAGAPVGGSFELTV